MTLVLFRYPSYISELMRRPFVYVIMGHVLDHVMGHVLDHVMGHVLGHVVGHVLLELYL